MDIEKLRRITELFLAEHKFEHEKLERLAEEAEETWSYDDYDQACYDSWQGMSEAGEEFAQQVLNILEGK